MDTTAFFAAHINKRISLTSAETAELLTCFSEKRIKRKQFVVLPGTVAKHRNFVVKGAFRAYVVDESGEEHTIQFAIEDWWISDYNSYIYQQPATMYMVALEDSIILQIDYNKEQQLKKAHHAFETFFRIMAERSAAFQQRRIISGLTQTAEERYNDFLERYPLLAQRVPQYALASYLGMTTSFLSRIRNRRLKKKS
ncbi:MAG TPA: Crp/Fnr family transcriptional regulator [Chitinophagaceae bacterium]|nr:Crp/Fnr family transcriptional regulator [Chitinophagaceae bacterium]